MMSDSCVKSITYELSYKFGIMVKESWKISNEFGILSIPLFTYTHFY